MHSLTDSISLVSLGVLRLRFGIDDIDRIIETNTFYMAASSLRATCVIFSGTFFLRYQSQVNVSGAFNASAPSFSLRTDCICEVGGDNVVKLT